MCDIGKFFNFYKIVLKYITPKNMKKIIKLDKNYIYKNLKTYLNFPSK